MAFGRRKNPEQDLENGESQTHTPEPRLPVIGRSELSTDDQLNIFRNLTGIVSHPSMARRTNFFTSGSQPTRPAPNLGIYARVVHNEETAKRGFKNFSWLINGCLGVQLIVAAALTAMGAAGASRSAVTVFGAINTVIAGVLTFLKGSGLPMRFKYYQSEWKRVREFIEQRERDFSRPDCNLDLYAVIDMVEQMYQEVKQDLEASTPDRFAGSKARTDTSQATMSTIRVPTAITLPRSEKYKELESSFGSRVKDIASQIDDKAEEARAVGKDLQSQKDLYADEINSGISGYREKVEEVEHGFGGRVKDLASDISQMAHVARETAQSFQAARKTGEFGREVEDLGGRAGRAVIPTRVDVPMNITFGGPKTELPKKE